MPENFSSDPDDLLTAKQVRQRFGWVSEMTIWNWLHSPTMGFPQPIYINARRYWRAGDIDAFLRDRGAA